MKKVVTTQLIYKARDPTERLNEIQLTPQLSASTTRNFTGAEEHRTDPPDHHATFCEGCAGRVHCL